MNILDFIMNGGTVKTSAGHNVKINDIVVTDQYGVKGSVVWNNGHESELEWDETGYPQDRRTHHCLNLVPVVFEQVSHTVPYSTLERFNDIESFYKSMGLKCDNIHQKTV